MDLFLVFSEALNKCLILVENGGRRCLLVIWDLVLILVENGWRGCVVIVGGLCGSKTVHRWWGRRSEVFCIS